MSLFDKFTSSAESYISDTAKLLESTTVDLHNGNITQDEFKELVGDILDYQKISNVVSDVQRLQEIVSAFQEMTNIVSQLISI